jgi:hypothetical protein
MDCAPVTFIATMLAAQESKLFHQILLGEREQRTKSEREVKLSDVGRRG